MIPWMREKFAERRAKWLARNNSKRSAPGSPTTSVTARSSNSSLRNFGLSSVRTAEIQTQTDDAICVSSTPSPVPQPPSSPHCAHTTTTTAQTEINLSEPTTSIQQNSFKQTAEQTQTTHTTTIKKKAHTRFVSSPENDDPDSDDINAAKPETIIVRVICPSARILIFKTDVTKRLADLKSEVILELCDDPDSIQLFAADVRHLNPRYRLFRAKYEGDELNETLTMQELQVRNNESFMLTPRRGLLTQHLTRTREVPGPSEQLVEVTTRYLPSNESNMPLIDINEIFQQSNIQYDVRKVLISLAQESASIIGTGPYAPRLISMLKQRLVNKRNHLIDTLQCLVDMGFKREMAEYALKANNNVYSTTLEWLIQNQSEESQEEHATIGMQRSQSSFSPSAIATNNESIENACALLEIVRIYSHSDVPPGEDMVESLTDMGFEEAAVVAALKKTGNNKAAACEWLCGNRSGSLTELRDGLSPDSPILKVILETPQVEMSLSNPKTFLAFLAILENEHAIRVWRGDTVTTSVITHILQKYHEEKHVLGINQFYNNR